MRLNAQRLSHTNLILLTIKDITEQERLIKIEKEMSAMQVRHHLARDLHDSVSQTLYAATILAESQLVQQERAEKPVNKPPLLQQVVMLNRSALAEMRTLLLELRPDTIHKNSLEKLLHQLMQSAQGRKTFTSEIMVEGTEQTLPEDVLVALYRIAQESINNIIKHSRANHYTVFLKQEVQSIFVRITDDGDGFDTSQSGSGFGLDNMRERAQEVGATLEINSQAGKGTTIEITWHKAAEEAD